MTGNGTTSSGITDHKLEVAHLGIEDFEIFEDYEDNDICEKCEGCPCGLAWGDQSEELWEQQKQDFEDESKQCRKRAHFGRCKCWCVCHGPNTHR